MADFPSTPKPVRMKIGVFVPTFVSTPHNPTAETRRTLGGHRWLIELSYAALSRLQYQPLWAFVVAQRGRLNSFTFTPFLHKDGQGEIGTSTPLVAGADQSGRSVVTDGWQVSTLVLKAGDFIRFYGHAKVYMVTTDTTSDGSGNATLSIEPALRSTVADNEVIICADVDFTVRVDSDDFELDITGKSADRSPASLSLVEVDA